MHLLETLHLSNAPRDLDAVRISLIQRLGPDFARSASGNRDKHVSQRALKAISPPIPSAAQLDAYMKDIAQSHGVNWNPDPPRQTLFVLYLYCFLIQFTEALLVSMYFQSSLILKSIQWLTCPSCVSSADTVRRLITIHLL